MTGVLLYLSPRGKLLRLSYKLSRHHKTTQKFMSLANVIDHTILKPDCTLADIEKVCKEALNHHFKAVCIPPFYVKEAKQVLENSAVKVSTVIGFPSGYSSTPAKVEEIKRALDDGADEFDVVINICAVKNGNWNFVQNDIESMTRAVHLKGRVIKIILETGLLTKEEIEKVCSICINSGVNFVKTSTGFNGPGASEEVVSFLRSILPPTIKIKASGGIRTKEAAAAMIRAGAERIGTSAGPELL